MYVCMYLLWIDVVVQLCCVEWLVHGAVPGFDPFAESCKGLQDLLAEEKRQAHPPLLSDPLLRLFRQPQFYGTHLLIRHTWLFMYLL